MTTITLAELTKMYDDDPDYFSTQYAEYIMEHGDGSTHPCCDGDMLLELMESGYLLEEFLDYTLDKFNSQRA